MTKERGFSLIEAIVVLLIASLVLTSVLEISSSAASRNARLAREVSAAADRQLDETFFRTLLASAMPPLQQAGEPPPTLVGEGFANELRFTLSPEKPVACASVRAYQTVSLRIVPMEGGQALLCEGDLGVYPLASWRGEGGQFSYSLDGQEWSAIYPAEERQSFFAQAADLGREEDIDALFRTAGNRKMIRAPIVRLTMPDGGSARVWMARLGQTMPVPLTRAELFEEGGDDGFLDIP
ncbi:MAG: type II secretion system protein [Parvularcula sp.]|nr:type II secretion system protein [Parvularcula sp.]